MFIDTVTVLTLKSKDFLFIFSINNNKLCYIVYICIMSITPTRECVYNFIYSHILRGASGYRPNYQITERVTFSTNIR